MTADLNRTRPPGVPPRHRAPAQYPSFTGPIWSPRAYPEPGFENRGGTLHCSRYVGKHHPDRSGQHEYQPGRFGDDGHCHAVQGVGDQQTWRCGISREMHTAMLARWDQLEGTR